MILVEEVLKDFGIEYEDKGNDFVIPCIFHEEKSPSFYVQKESGIYHAFCCGESGNFFQLVRTISGFSVSETFQYLSRFISVRRRSRMDKYNDFLSAIQRQCDLAAEEEDKEAMLPENIKVRSNKYLRERGLTDQEIMFWDMRVCITHPYKNWILTPVRRNNKIQTYFLRSVNDGGKIYGYKTIVKEDGSKKNEGYYRSNILFGMDHCTDYTSPIVVSEGIFDSIFNKRYCNQSVAALSNNILPEQKKFLKNFSEIILLPDNDMRGMFMIDTALSLSTTNKMSIALLPDKFKDSGETKDCHHVIGEAIENRVDLMDFIVSNRYREFLRYKKYKLKRKK